MVLGSPNRLRPAVSVLGPPPVTRHGSAVKRGGGERLRTDRRSIGAATTTEHVHRWVGGSQEPNATLNGSPRIETNSAAVIVEFAVVTPPFPLSVADVQRRSPTWMSSSQV